MTQAQKITVRHTKGKEYEFEVIIDTGYYQQWYTEELFPVIKEKTRWLESGGGNIH